MDSIDVKSVLQIIKRNSWLIIGLTIISVLIAGIITFFVIPKGYSATTQILVTQAGESDVAQSSEVQANIQMVNTYAVILKNTDLLKEVAKDFPVYSAKDIASRMTVSSDSNSQVLNLTIKDDNPYVAVSLANNLAAEFQKRAQKLIKTNEVSILSKADIEESKNPTSPNHMIHLAIGVVVGLFLAFLVIVLKEIFDSSIKTEADVEKLLGLPILGVVNHVDRGGAKR
ncbi:MULTISPECIES: YveK family protein [Listeria]|uniref:YveK family protein n=1 Tax=Listeria TaxID=1637 RepID=UPI0013563CF7|nr:MULTISPECIES: Wzz/FepE/Etk N-terminal domain-containing protein [Listeria]